jgi:hypothetical protein
MAIATAASADEPPFEFGPTPGWQVLGGVNGGGSFGSQGGGGFAGAELSFNRLMAGWWTGAYVDGVYDFGHSAATVSAGPEIGYGVIGLDGGAAVQFGAGDPSWGPQARLLVTAGVFSIFGRYTYLTGPEAHIGQAGVLFKLPLWAQ